MTLPPRLRVLAGYLWLPVSIGVAGLLVINTQSTANVFLFSMICTAAMAALGLNLLMGTAGQISIGNAAFMAVGGFVTVTCHRAGVPFPADLAVATLFAAIVGLVVGLPALRLRGVYLLLSTLAAHFIVLYFAQRYQANKVGESGFTFDSVFGDLEFAKAGRLWAWLAVASLGATCVVYRTLSEGNSGNTLRFVRDHEAAAPALGISATHVKLRVFVISAMMVAVAGGLQGHIMGVVSVDNYHLSLAIAFIAMIVIGGMDSATGAVVGALFVTALPQLVTHVVGQVASDEQLYLQAAAPQLSTLIYGLIIILFITFRPDGLAGMFAALGHGFVSIRERRASRPASKECGPPRTDIHDDRRSERAAREGGNTEA